MMLPLLRRRRNIAVLASATILVASALVGSSMARAEAETASTDQHAADLAAASLTEQLEGMPSWAGVTVDETTVRVQLTAAPTAEITKILAGAAEDPVPVEYDIVQYAYPELEAIVERIAADSEWLAREGIKPTLWGIDQEKNAVTLEVESLTDATAKKLVERYGAALVVGDGQVASTLSVH
ncbi:MAG: hypothetical protein QM602_07940 [Microbacterium sp.]